MSKMLNKLDELLNKGYKIEFFSYCRMRMIKFTYKNVSCVRTINELDFNEKVISWVFDEAEYKYENEITLHLMGLLKGDNNE